MSRMSRFAFALLLLATTSCLALAADPVPGDAKSLDKAVTDSLRDVHNYGADLYNQAKDYAGAYRVYEGALRTVRPLLGHRPDTRKTIDAGLATAAAETDPARRAFLLHETIENVRAELKGESTAPKPVEPKKPVPKKTIEPNKPVPKKTIEPNKPVPPAPKAKGNGEAGITGRVFYQGKPVEAGTIMFVSLSLKEPRVLGGAIKDGAYSIKDVPAGTYAVIVSADKGGKDLLPAKYATTDSSELRVEVKGGSATFDFELK
jgi:hypothetical protein